MYLRINIIFHQEASVETITIEIFILKLEKMSIKQKILS